MCDSVAFAGAYWHVSCRSNQEDRSRLIRSKFVAQELELDSCDFEKTQKHWLNTSKCCFVYFSDCRLCLPCTKSLAVTDKLCTQTANDFHQQNKLMRFVYVNLIKHWGERGNFCRQLANTVSLLDRLRRLALRFHRQHLVPFPNDIVNKNNVWENHQIFWVKTVKQSFDLMDSTISISCHSIFFFTLSRFATIPFHHFWFSGLSRAGKDFIICYKTCDF